MAPIPIPPGREDEARGYVTGDWARLNSVVVDMNTLGFLARNAGENLKPLDKKELWQGTAAEGFRDDLGIVVDVLKLYGKVYPKAAGELAIYAEALKNAQHKVDFEIIPKAKQATALSQAHAGTVATYDSAKAVRDQAKKDGVPKDCLPAVPDKPGDDPGKKLRREAESDLGSQVHSLVEAGAKVQQQWRRHLDELQGTPDLYKTLKRFGIDFAKGAGTSLLSIAEFAWSISPGRMWTEPGAYFTDLAAIAKDMTKPIWNPVGFYGDTRASVAATWEEFKNNPARTLGAVAPDVALALLTRGGAKGRTPRELAEDRARLEAENPCRNQQSCGFAGEPVDVATGELVIDETDVCLAGVLPLLLGRRYRAFFSRGRRFGPRWASTLDQHIELGADGVRLVTSDGVELRYPVPEPAASVMPVAGDRWPLRWDGTAGGAFTVTDPGRGWTWTFAPVPGLDGPVLPVRTLSDRGGTRIDFHYDANGDPTEVVHSGGYRIAVDTAEGRVTALRLCGADPQTHRRPRGLDSAGRLSVLALRRHDRGGQFLGRVAGLHL